MNHISLSNTLCPDSDSSVFFRLNFDDEDVSTNLIGIPSKFTELKKFTYPLCYNIVLNELSDDCKFDREKFNMLKCKHCNSVINTKSQISGKDWICDICFGLNLYVDGHFFPKLDIYEFNYDTVDEKPLMLFFIQNTKEVLDNLNIEQFSSSLRSFAASNYNAKIGLVILSEFITVFDLLNSKSTTYIDNDYVNIDTCVASKCNFLSCLQSINQSSVHDFIDLLNKSLNSLNNSFTIINIIASHIDNKTKLSNILEDGLKKNNIIINVFAMYNVTNLELLEKAYRLYYYNKGEEMFLNHDISDFLTMKFYLNVNVKFYSSRSLRMGMIYHKNVSSSSSTVLPFIDNKSSFTISAYLTGNTFRYLSSQLSILYTTLSGERRLRIINSSLYFTESICSFNALAHITYLCKFAVYSLNNDPENLVYNNLKKEFNEFIDNNVNVQHRDCILPSCFRDFPLLFYSLIHSSLFSFNNKIENIIAKNNLMIFSPSYVKRFLYPLLLPVYYPLSPIRLNVKEAKCYKSLLLVDHYHGYLYGEYVKVEGISFPIKNMNDGFHIELLENKLSSFLDFVISIENFIRSRRCI